ncbi:MAG: pyruvate kinase, partial [Bacilli bacterium]|nr:pyruvate kinase [Bacilli bacterium]
MNKTKIIATIGPSSSDIEVLRDLILNGMDVARINLSHANYAFCEDIISKINELNSELNTHVAIMFDTKGPDIRVGKFFGGEAYLKTGDKIRIYMDRVVGDQTKFSVSYPDLINDVKYDSIIKLDSGLIELKVLDKGKNYLMCEVLSGGIIRDGRGLNVPSIRLNRPFLSKKDIEDIKFANKMGIDFLALSFVSTAENILEVNDLLIELGNDHIGIIAKIENEIAVQEIDEIINMCEGVMIARGDLGVEIPMERIPGIQKKIINKCLMTGKISIVATELMASMEHQIRPTRAEVSDVANAVLDGADSVMLSGETTIGKYPVESLAMMEKIISSAEIDIDYMGLLEHAVKTEKQDITGILAYNVAESANRLN